MDPASLMLVSLDFLLMETAASSSALIMKSVVCFFNFLFSQIILRPVASRASKEHLWLAQV